MDKAKDAKSVLPLPGNARVHPAPPSGAPEQLKPESLTRKLEKAEPAMVPIESHTTTDEGLRLCLPTRFGTLLSSMAVSVFMLLGLMAFCIAEDGFNLELQSDEWLVLLWRVLGWAFLFYVPVLWIACGSIRYFCVFGVSPWRWLSVDHRLPWTHRTAPFVRHTFWIVTMSAWICIPWSNISGGVTKWFGLLPVYLLSLFSIPIAFPLAKPITAPEMWDKHATTVAPVCVFLPILGFGIIASAYTALSYVAGTWLGLLMPALLSGYEFLGTALMMRIFTQNFLINREARNKFRGTNQAIAVSTGICNLHAMAEGARLTLLYQDSIARDDFTILVPIVSGMLWNVLVRIGCFDLFLYRLTRGRWKPSNGSKLLRRSGLCIGYMRFGSVAVLLLTRFCLGTLSWGRELQLFGMMLAAEVLEDSVTSLLWRANIDVTPEAHMATDEEVDCQVLQRQKGRSSSKELRGSGAWLPVTPQTSEPQRGVSVDPEVDPEVDQLRDLNAECEAAATANDPTVTPTGTLRQPAGKQDSQDHREVRESTNFRFGPQEFGSLPFWAHLVPAALAQFHTILTLSMFSGGFVHVVALCPPHGHDHGVVWWPMGGCVHHHH